ncbi:MAG: SOS response-associated peptidase [Chitinophagaceae bacterium]|nr:MAG: SOS response-associated peptidase [Chitinophagaceae bacterium]
MCYYNGVKVKKEAIQFLVEDTKGIENFERDLQSGFEYSLFPVAMKKKEKTRGELTHWEFIPFWYKNMKEVEEGRKKYTTLNAQGEKLLTSKIYKEAAHERRCLVLSSGFYEWRHHKGVAYPYHIRVKDKDTFFMAGIYQPWTDKETGERLDTFAIVTTEADALMTQVHNKKKRMPTILTDETAELWLSEDLSEKEIKELATFHTTDTLEAYTLRKDFRSAHNPKEPYDYPDLPPLKVA